MSRSLYDEDGVDGPWLKAMNEGPWHERLLFEMSDGTSIVGYLQGAGGIVDSISRAESEVRRAKEGRPLRIATKEGAPTVAFLYSSPHGVDRLCTEIDLAKVISVETA